MTTNVLKWLIVVGGIVAGVLVLTRTFRGLEPQVPVGGSPAATQTPSPGGDQPMGTMGDIDQTGNTKDVSGVRIGVYNGTDVDGLAADLEKEYRKNDGVVVSEIGDTMEPVADSVIYYAKSGDRSAAETFVEGKLKNADVLELPRDFRVVVNGQITRPDKGVQVLVVLGEDYAG